MTPAVRGRYADGQTAGLAPVQVHLEAAGLAIVDEAGARLGVWSYDELEAAEAIAAGRPVRLRLGDDKGARLTLEPASAL